MALVEHRANPPLTRQLTESQSQASVSVTLFEHRTDPFLKQQLPETVASMAVDEHHTNPSLTLELLEGSEGPLLNNAPISL